MNIMNREELLDMCKQYLLDIKDLQEAVRVRDLYIETLKQSIIDAHKSLKNYSFNREDL